MKWYVSIIFIGVHLLAPMQVQAAESDTDKVLIIFYSLSGRTKAVAELLQSKTGATDGSLKPLQDAVV
ncbi:MAG: hypothetical protein LIQ30_02705 [Planctomycetes bacterium]|nr:hypothetical protein [Planctomycetota bacterium]MCD7895100.1 hypothetical protein [Planctomycetaceae bacterium]